MFCEHCGTQNEVHQTQCIRCGQPLGTYRIPIQNSKASPRRSPQEPGQRFPAARDNSEPTQRFTVPPKKPIPLSEDLIPSPPPKRQQPASPQASSARVRRNRGPGASQTVTPAHQGSPRATQPPSIPSPPARKGAQQPPQIPAVPQGRPTPGKPVATPNIPAPPPRLRNQTQSRRPTEVPPPPPPTARSSAPPVMPNPSGGGIGHDIDLRQEAPEPLRRSKRSGDTKPPMQPEDSRKAASRAETYTIPREDRLSTSQQQKVIPTPSYAAGEPTAQQQEKPATWTLSPLWRRFFALITDSILVLGIGVGAAMLGPLKMGSDIPVNIEQLADLIASGALLVPVILMLLTALLGSYLFHAKYSATPGKLLFGLEIVGFRTGAKVSGIRTVMRTILSMVSLLLLGAGYAWLIVDRRSRTWHDTLCSTAVVLSSSRRH